MISVVIGAVANLILDPIFIFAFGMGIRGAAIATVISQILSAAFVLHFLLCKAEYKVRLLHREEIRASSKYAKNIISLGTAGFIMQLTTQPGNNLLQSRTFCHRRNALYFCHDNHLQRASVG